MKIKNILFIFIFLFIIKNVSGAITTDSIQTSLAESDSASNVREGVKIIANYNSTILNFTKHSSSGCSQGYILDASKVVLKNTTFIGNNCPINYNITSGGTYFIVCNNNGSNYNRVYNTSVTTPAMPLNRIAINFTKGISTSTEYTNMIFEITNVTTEVYTPSGATTYNVTNYANISNISTSILRFNVTTYVNKSDGSSLNINGSVTIYYQPVTSMNNGCSIFYGKTCISYNNSYMSKSMSMNSNYNESSVTLFDGDMYPAYYPFNFTTIDNTIHANYTLYQNNNMKFLIYNFSNTTSYYINLEFMAMNESSSTSALLIYYCNSSYINGNPLLSSNCELIDSFLPKAFDHYHANYSAHHFIPMVIKNISKTQFSQIVFISPNVLPANGWKFGYINNSNYLNDSFVIGSYVTWTQTPNTNRIFDVHIHPIDTSSDYFKFYTTYNDTVNLTNSSFNYLFYNISYQKPTGVNFLSPSCDNFSQITYGSNQDIVVDWTSSSSQLNYTINYTLFVSDTTNVYDNDIYAGYDSNYTYNWSDWNSFLFGGYDSFGYSDYYFYVTIDDGLAQERSELECSFQLCFNDYQPVLTQCIANTQHLYYYDVNGCPEQLNTTGFEFPSDNNTYIDCVIPPTQGEENIEIAIYSLVLVIFICLAIFVYYRRNENG